MLKKFAYLILALTMISILSACNRGSSDKTAANSTPAANTYGPSDKNGLITPNPTYPNGKPVVHPEPILHNAVAGDDVVLPSDVPVFPKAESTGKRVTNIKHIFDFKVDASQKAVNDFYNAELKKQGWVVDTQMSNSTDGLLYSKPNRFVQVITNGHAGKDNSCEFHLFVTDRAEVAAKEAAAKGVTAGDDPTHKFVGNIGDLIKMPKNIPDDVPLYQNAQRKISEHPRMWYEYRSKDSVDQIASFYSSKMKDNGWKVQLDTSELGDSMVIYTKNAENGDKRYIGVRVNDMKDQKERWLTLILYPDNVVIPNVQAPSKLANSQK